MIYTCTIFKNNFGKVIKCAFTYKILHFPTQSLNTSQFDWSKAEPPPDECHSKL